MVWVAITAIGAVAMFIICLLTAIVAQKEQVRNAMRANRRRQTLRDNVQLVREEKGDYDVPARGKRACPAKRSDVL